MSLPPQFNVDRAAEIIKSKLKLREFLLQTKDFKKELDQSCVCYHKKLQEKKQLQINFKPFIVTFNCRFGDLVDRKKINFAII